MDKIFFHHDKASSHSAILTHAYLDVQAARYGLRFLPNEIIPVKAADISPSDFFGFGFIKQKAENCKATTLESLWHYWKEQWNTITPDMCLKVFKTWKRRLRLVSRRDGGHIEHLKSIHKRKVNL